MDLLGTIRSRAQCDFHSWLHNLPVKPNGPGEEHWMVPAHSKGQRHRLGQLSLCSDLFSGGGVFLPFTQVTQMSLDPSQGELYRGLALKEFHPFPFQHFLWPQSMVLPSLGPTKPKVQPRLQIPYPLQSSQRLLLLKRQQVVKLSSSTASPLSVLIL